MSYNKIIGQNIRSEREQRNITQTELAKRIGTSAVNLLRWEKGERRVSMEYLDKIAKALSESEPISIIELMFEDVSAHQKSMRRKVPIIGAIHAGLPTEAIEKDAECFVEVDLNASPNARALVVEGESMNKVAQDGDVIIFDPDQKWPIPEKLYALRVNGTEAVFRRYKVSENNQPLFTPESTEEGHPVIDANNGKVEIIGRVILRAQKEL